MSMAERRENSVLFSLRELRKIEDDRVKQEQDEVVRRDLEAKEKVAAEERRQRDEAARAAREAEAAERARQEEATRQAREEQLRLEVAERKHRVEAQMKLEEQRLKMEIEARANVAAAKKPKGLIIASAILVLIVAGLGVFLFMQKQDQDKKNQDQMLADAARDKAAAEMRRNYDSAMASIQADDEHITQLIGDLKKAQDDDTKKRLQAQLDAAVAEKKVHEGNLSNIKQHTDRPDSPPAVKPPAGPVKIETNKCKDPNDPLCGI